MKKSQISFEFIVLFAIVLFVFVLLISFFPKWLDKTAATKSTAEKLANDIKVKAITASLSESDFESQVIIPGKINNINISVEIFGDPDNMLIVKDRYSDKALARVFLPEIDEVSGNPNGRLLTVKKEAEANWLSIERT